MPALPPLHLLVGDDLLAAANLPERLGSALAAGGRALALHLRARSVTARQLHDAAATVTALARAHGTTVIVNDRLDVALAAGAHGVHLREDSLPGGVARQIVGEGLLLGRSIHDPVQVRGAGDGGGSGDAAGGPDARRTGARSLAPAGERARSGPGARGKAQRVRGAHGGRAEPAPPSAAPGDEIESTPSARDRSRANPTEASPAPPPNPLPIPLTDLRALDYLVLGAIYPTRSHPGRAPVGIGALARAAAWSDRPVLAIGGVTPERVAEVAGCGAGGVVVRSGVWGAGRPGEAVQRYLEALAK